MILNIHLKVGCNCFHICLKLALTVIRIFEPNLDRTYIENLDLTSSAFWVPLIACQLKQHLQVLFFSHQSFLLVPSLPYPFIRRSEPPSLSLFLLSLGRLRTCGIMPKSCQLWQCSSWIEGYSWGRQVVLWV
mgnify:CR=1 FL=1